MLVGVDPPESRASLIIIMAPKMGNYLDMYHFQSFLRITFIVWGLAVTVWNVNYNLQIYLKYLTKTEMTIEPNTRTARPPLTICLNSLHSKSKF